VDGSFSYSNIISVKVDAEDDILTVTPSLLRSGNNLQVTWHSKFNRRLVVASLVNAMGQEVHTQTISAGANTLYPPKLKAGLYYIVVDDFSDAYQLARLIVVD